MPYMRALLIEKRGVDNLKVGDISVPEVGPHDVKVKITMASVQAQDYSMAETLSAHGNPVSPIPHIPGEEMTGEIVETGAHVSDFSNGDRVIVYHRIFDGTCDMCKRGYENLCRERGRFGVDKNGGIAEFLVVPSTNVIKISDDLSQELAASVAVSMITPYHALKKVYVNAEDTVAVFGATGNTGMFAIQIAKEAGARVIAVTRRKREWLKDLGADYVTTPDNVLEDLREITDGRMCSIVIDPLGRSTWEKSIPATSFLGRWVSYGALSGDSVPLSLIPFYRDEKTILGTRGGTKAEISQLVEIADRFKVKEWRRYKLESSPSAIRDYVHPEREGKLFVTP